MSGSCGASVMQEVVRCVDEQTPNHVKSFVVAGIEKSGKTSYRIFKLWLPNYSKQQMIFCKYLRCSNPCPT